MTCRIPKKANPVQQHRKAIGNWEQRAQRVTKKSMCKAIRKARNASESSRTIDVKQNHKSTSTALKALVIVGIFSTLIAPAKAMHDGIRNSDVKAETVFPYIGCRASVFRSARCSGTRLNSRYLLSARHCFEGGRTTVWAYNRGSWIGNYIWAKNVVVHPYRDVAIVELDTPAKGNIPCIPMMDKETSRNLERSQPDINGKNTGRYTINAVGSGSNDEGRLFAGFYDHIDNEELRGIKHFNNPTPCVRSGDSGSSILGINPKTGDWELRGVVADRIENDHFGKGCALESNVFVDTTEPELQEWILEQIGGEFCTPTENNKISIDNLVPKAKESNFDPCKAPTNIYDSIEGLNICECYDKKVIPAPEKYNCTPSAAKPSATSLEDTRGAIQCLDIQTNYNPPKVNFTVKNNCKEEFLTLLFQNMNGEYIKFHHFAKGKSVTSNTSSQINKAAGLTVIRANGYKEFYPNYFEYAKPTPLTTTETVTTTPTTTLPALAPTTEPTNTTLSPTTTMLTVTPATEPLNTTQISTTKPTAEQMTEATTKPAIRATIEPTIATTIAESENSTSPPKEIDTKQDLFIGFGAVAALATGIGITISCQKNKFRSELNFESVQTINSSDVELKSVAFHNSWL